MRRAVKALDHVPPSACAGYRPDSEATKLHNRLRGELRGELTLLRQLQERYVEALPPACDHFVSHAGVLGTPLGNLMKCHDLCARAVDEARRSLAWIERRLTGTAEAPFLEPAVYAARLQNAAVDRREGDRMAEQSRARSDAFTREFLSSLSKPDDRATQIDPSDKKIVEHLRKHPREKLLGRELAAVLHLNENSIKKNLARLVKLKQIHNDGDRRGYYAMGSIGSHT